MSEWINDAFVAKRKGQNVRSLIAINVLIEGAILEYFALITVTIAETVILFTHEDGTPAGGFAPHVSVEIFNETFDRISCGGAELDYTISAVISAEHINNHERAAQVLAMIEAHQDKIPF